MAVIISRFSVDPPPRFEVIGSPENSAVLSPRISAINEFSRQSVQLSTHASQITTFAQIKTSCVDFQIFHKHVFATPHRFLPGIYPGKV